MEEAYKQMMSELEAFVQKHADIFMKLGEVEFKTAKVRGDIPADARVSTREDFLHDICVDIAHYCEDKKEALK